GSGGDPGRTATARHAPGAVHGTRRGDPGAGVTDLGSPGADLCHVDTWLFDLDNTIYPLESGLGVLIEQKITDYVVKVTGLPREEAYVLQKQWLADHGLTLRGLMVEHGVDPADYHAQFADLSLECLAAADLHQRRRRPRRARGGAPGTLRPVRRRLPHRLGGLRAQAAPRHLRP